MAYDERLADRVRELVGGREGFSERKMFGGIAFMLRGNMCCGVMDEDLIVRLGDEAGPLALEEPAVRPFDFTGRPMKSTVLVDSSGTAEEGELARWVDAGADFASGLPPK